MSDLEIARDDVALSAIASGNAPGSDDPTLLLLASFRADLDQAASPATATVVPLAPARKRRSGALIALSAAAGIVVGGLTAGAVVASDRPGESLHSVHVAVFGESRTDTDEVTALLDDAAGMLARGDRPAARRLLGRAATLIPGVPESDQPALRRRLDDLSAYAAEPAGPSPSPSPSATQRSPEPSETPEPSESESADDNSGSGSGSSGSGSGSDDEDNSGSGSSNSGSGSSNSGRGR